MREDEVTKFLVSISGQIELVRFPGGVFDHELYICYEVVWGPDWEVISGLTTGTSQASRSGSDPEVAVFNMPLELVFSSTNISGWPQLIITVRASNLLTGDALRGYSLVLTPPSCGTRRVTSPIVRPKAATVLGEWISWITGKYPELTDVKILATGKDNYLLRTESYGAVELTLTMTSKDLRRLGYDNEHPYHNNKIDFD